MSSTTPNIGLTKTTAAETIGQNWAASNDSGGNFDIIDTKMGAVGNTSLQAQVTALNSNITNNYTDYDSTGKYHIRISQMGKMVTVSGVIFGTGTSEYLSAVALPTPAKYDGGSELMGNALIFYARNQNTGATKQLRCGSSYYIYLDSDMASGVPFAFAFSYCKA